MDERVHRTAFVVSAIVFAAALMPVWAQTPRRAMAPRGPLNTLNDVRRAILGCWEWPPVSMIRSGMELTVLLSFRRDGEIFGARITYQWPDVSPGERGLYYSALLRAIKLCSPLPLSPSLGEAIAGRPFRFRFRDTRKQKQALFQGSRRRGDPI